MGVAIVENRNYYYYHPALEKVQALNLLSTLKQDEAEAIIEGCIPDYIHPNDFRMKFVFVARTIFNNIGLEVFSNPLSEFLKEHNMVRALALSSNISEESQGVFGRIKGVALVAKDTGDVEMLTTNQSSGTWVSSGNLESPNLACLSFVAQGATPIPVYLPNERLLAGWGIGFLRAHTIRLA